MRIATSKQGDYNLILISWNSFVPYFPPCKSLSQVITDESGSAQRSSRLSGRTVLIFGGSSGLGYGAAEACIENGMAVVIASSSEAKIDEAVQRLLKTYPSAGGRFPGHICDLGDQATLEHNVLQLLEKVGKVDHIIYSAGDSVEALIQPLDQITTHSAIKSHIVRYLAPMMVSKHAKKYLTPGPYSSLTLTSGAITLRPIKDWVLANGVMSAVEGLTQALALELAPIRVNAVQPGVVATEMWDCLGEEAFASMKANVEANAPTQRVAQPEDIANAYLYTLKDPNLTGAVIKTDSGNNLK
ncbi:hypothetical protein PRZ48_008543 [Zasmidium cellare]|uniref:Uncharacterized protein n=1 Tax=Zasmidium cellare TaxID=395010 RepID=A0ABR0EG55_ZASCE|nr:hypothetical protein PRZ48_008543 [Zasmidium cellare]